MVTSFDCGIIILEKSITDYDYCDASAFFFFSLCIVDKETRKDKAVFLIYYHLTVVIILPEQTNAAYKY